MPSLTSKSTCQRIQGRGVSVVTSAIIHASKLMIPRNTCCSILERSPLPAISAASLTGGQADWNITCFPILMRNPLLARNANTNSGSPVIWRSIYTRHQHQANDLFLILTLLCYDLRGQGGKGGQWRKIVWRDPVKKIYPKCMIWEFWSDV